MSPTMDAARWERMKQAFSAVIAAGPPHNGGADQVLDACGGDADLAAWVRALVEEHFRLANVVEKIGAREPSEIPDLPPLVAGRYRILSRLGGGSFGDVYRVSDETGAHGELALKVLRSSDPFALQHFKREFRSLSGTWHRNIVRLHELITHWDRYMFTMEYVDGVDLLRYLDGCPPVRRESALRSCMLQLAEGLSVLHRHHLLHRDVKPSNILVTPKGRLVLLDFGLVRTFGEDRQSLATFAGTPNYMSPEQAAGVLVGEPSDWYAVGVILYECLTGKAPFDGSFVEVLRRKQVELPVPPSDLVPGISPALNALCLKLLERDPLSRASYADVVRWAEPAGVIPTPEAPSSLFVGRREPLERLHACFAAAQERPVIVHISGPSGIGKTALLREFMTQIEEDPSALVFAGRCYDGENLPYQAMDDLIDHVGHYFRRLSRHRVERLLPRNFAILVKMFPVLAPFLPSDTRAAAGLNSFELRTRALAALRELLGRLSERHRIVLAIDDLQWGDIDGCAALNDLLTAADSPPVLVVLAYRSEDAGVAPALATLRAPTGGEVDRGMVFIQLDQFDDSESRELAQSLLSEPPGEDTLRCIAEQSSGNPFLIKEIVRWIRVRGPNPVLNSPFSLRDVVRSRMDSLTAEAGLCLELVAIAGQPCDLRVVQLACGLADALSVRDELVYNRLLRCRTLRGREEVEIYHDRIRTMVLAELDDGACVRRHRQFARALESAGGHDPERIAAHYEQARDPQLCARYALIAARRARDVLAFNESARFFEMAICTGALDAAELPQVHRECADALANAGRGPNAAEHYIAACRGATIDEQLECNLSAAEQWLYSGHVDRGLGIFASVLEQVGIRSPAKNRSLPLVLLWRRALLRLRGLSWRERPASEVPRNVLLKIDACASVATGLALIDVTRGAALQSAGLQLALNAGEPNRIARALAMEAGYRSTGGIAAATDAESLLGRASDLSARTGDPRAIGLTRVMAAACAWNAGCWSECYNRARAAREFLNDRYERLTWERDTASIFEVDALRWMGRWSAMQEILPELIEDARYRGDLYAQAILQMHGGSCTALAGDNPERARAGLRVLELWSNTGFHVEHLIEIHNRVEIALYLGHGAEAADIVLACWPALKRSLLLRVEALGIQMRSLRARAALAAAVERPELTAVARRESRILRRGSARWGIGLGELIAACAESFSGRPDRALASFAIAEKSFAAAGMLLHELFARRCRGLLTGSVEGLALVQSAEAGIRAESIVSPERLARVFAPVALPHVR